MSDQTSQTPSLCRSCDGTGILGITSYRAITGLVKREIICPCSRCAICLESLRGECSVSWYGRQVHAACHPDKVPDILARRGLYAVDDRAIDGALLSHSLMTEAQL